MSAPDTACKGCGGRGRRCDHECERCKGAGVTPECGGLGGQCCEGAALNVGDGTRCEECAAEEAKRHPASCTRRSPCGQCQVQRENLTERAS